MRRVLANILLAALTVAGLCVLAYGASLVDTKVVMVASAVRLAPSLEAADQPVADGVVTVRHVVAPADGWVAAQTVAASGKLVLNQVVGTARVSAGDTRDVRVQLDEPFRPGDQLLLTLHVDAGRRGGFEFPSSADRAVMLDGAVVSNPVRVLVARPATPASTVADGWPTLVLAAGLLAGGWWLFRRRGAAAQPSADR
jgi:hypothetical protein